MKINNGFEKQKERQVSLISASIFNMHRMSKMSDKKLREELGGGEDLIEDTNKLRTYAMSKEVKDILSYQANIKLLTKLQKKYGEKESTSNLIGDLQSDFGITTEE